MSEISVLCLTASVISECSGLRPFVCVDASRPNQQFKSSESVV